MKKVICLWHYDSIEPLTAIILFFWNHSINKHLHPILKIQAQESSPYSVSWPVIWEQGSRKMQHCHTFQQKGRRNIRRSLRVERIFPWRPVFILSSSQYLMALVLAPTGNSTKYMITIGQPQKQGTAFLKPQKYFRLCFQCKGSVNSTWSSRESTVIAYKTEARPAPTGRKNGFWNCTYHTTNQRMLCHLKSSFMSERDVPHFNTAMSLESLFHTGLGPGWSEAVKM